MNQPRFLPLALSALLGAASSVPALAGDEAPQVENFSLYDAQGQPFVLYDRDLDTVGTVLAWTSLDCMVAKLYLPRLAEMAEIYGAEGIRFYGVDPNIQDTPAEILARFEKVGVELPVLMDPMQSLTDAVGIERTTEVLLLDRDHRVIYRGAIDDQYDVGASKPFPREEWLVEAIEALLAGEDIETARTDPAGCLVGRILDTKQIDLTYARDIAPILDRHCVECHRPGQIGPMSLLDAEEVRGWAPMIAEVVGEGRMPPWHANPAHGQFANRRMLTGTEKRQLAVWADNGAPLGDLGERPPAPTFDDDGWAIGKPDLILDLPEAQEIPATGVIDYRYVMVDPKITEDRWIQSMEIRPTSTAATHHVLVLLIPPGLDGVAAFRQIRSDPEVAGGAGGYFAVQVPGCRPNIYPEGMGKKLPAGAKLLFQLHYTATGVPEEDRTRLAIRWCEEVPEIEVKTMGIYNFGLDIPPGEPAATFHARRSFDTAIEVLSIFPHMHARGAAFRMEVLGAERDEIVLDVPRYDFNWQNFYRPAQPLLIDSGETIYLTAVYDNSEDNPMNPDPRKRVRWGDQTFDEMMIGYMDYIEHGRTESPR